jgi:hypothetical protein
MKAVDRSLNYSPSLSRRLAPGIILPLGLIKYVYVLMRRNESRPMFGPCFSVIPKRTHARFKFFILHRSEKQPPPPHQKTNVIL